MELGGCGWMAHGSLFLARARILIIILPSPLIVGRSVGAPLVRMIHKGNFAIFWYAKEFREEWASPTSLHLLQQSLIVRDDVIASYVVLHIVFLYA